MIGLKADASPNGGVSNWTAIKSMFLFAGPATLAGALIPLKGATPTNTNFIGTDHARLTGLLGRGAAGATTINSNRAANTDPQNNHSFGVWLSSQLTGVRQDIASGGVSSPNKLIGWSASATFTSSNNVAAGSAITPGGAGFLGVSRNSSANFQRIITAAAETVVQASAGQNNSNFHFFSSGGSTNYAYSRGAIGWLGESTTLATMKSRLDTYMAALV